MEYKHFKCFKCHIHNHFYIPKRIKGQKCKRCHIFNYFNYFKKRNNNQRNRNYLLNLPFRNVPIRRNLMEIIDNNMMNRNQQRIEYIHNNNNNDFFQENNDQIFSLNNENNEPVNNNNYNNNNINYINNINIFNNALENNLMHQNNEEFIDISWLKKEKITKNILDKYGKDYLCTICFSELKGDIYITKCNHIFHYKCIEEAVKKKIKECPNCRSNLRTGEKKKVNNLEHNNQINNEIIVNNRFDNINNNLNWQRRNIMERNMNESNLLSDFIYYLLIIFLILIIIVAIFYFFILFLIILFYVIFKVIQFSLAIGFLYFLLKCFKNK